MFRENRRDWTDGWRDKQTDRQTDGVQHLMRPLGTAAGRITMDFNNGIKRNAKTQDKIPILNTKQGLILCP